MDIQLIAEDFQFPEGPIAMNDGSVILTEIKRQTLTRVTPDGKKKSWWRPAAVRMAQPSVLTVPSISPIMAVLFSGWTIRA